MSDPLTSEELDRRASLQAYAAAVKLLGRRDHSVAELTRKLKQREHTCQAIEAAMEILLSSGYVNDARYAERYAEQRMNQGYGPLSIRSKLGERGIDAHQVQDALRTLNVDWEAQACRVISRRFSAVDISDDSQPATARIARFLSNRGFSPGDALRALKRLRRKQIPR
ncbi:MAG: regulatory protein RecX [Granulosicoccus sp.]|nr:regulatory protein RecX [Granulosicoccus sp.]